MPFPFRRSPQRPIAHRRDTAQTLVPAPAGYRWLIVPNIGNHLALGELGLYPANAVLEPNSTLPTIPNPAYGARGNALRRLARVPVTPIVAAEVYSPQSLNRTSKRLLRSGRGAIAKLELDRQARHIANKHYGDNVVPDEALRLPSASTRPE